MIGHSLLTHPQEDPQVRFYLQFHRERIDEYHYLYPYDYARLCTRVMLTMAESFDPLRHALVAFSCFQYAVKASKQEADALPVFEQSYRIAQKHLDSRTNESTPLPEEIEMNIATALVLATFHVSSYILFMN